MKENIASPWDVKVLLVTAIMARGHMTKKYFVLWEAGCWKKEVGGHKGRSLSKDYLSSSRREGASRSSWASGRFAAWT